MATTNSTTKKTIKIKQVQNSSRQHTADRALRRRVKRFERGVDTPLVHEPKKLFDEVRAVQVEREEVVPLAGPRWL
jgi:hypothetical protein